MKRHKYFKNFLDPVIYGVSVKSGSNWYVLPVRKSKVEKVRKVKDELSKHWNSQLIEIGKKHYTPIEILK